MRLLEVPQPRQGEIMYQSSQRGPGIRGTQVKSSVRMKKTQESSKWLFLDNLIPEIESKAPN